MKNTKNTGVLAMIDIMEHLQGLALQGNTDAIKCVCEYQGLNEAMVYMAMGVRVSSTGLLTKSTPEKVAEAYITLVKGKLEQAKKPAKEAKADLGKTAQIKLGTEKGKKYPKFDAKACGLDLVEYGKGNNIVLIGQLGKRHFACVHYTKFKTCYAGKSHEDFSKVVQGSYGSIRKNYILVEVTKKQAKELIDARK